MQNRISEKSTAYAATYMSERRRRAREAGLCITCCKAPRNERLAVCVACSEKATQRSDRRRKSLRKLAGVQRIVQAHVRAGNEAYEHHLYADATQYYQDALKTRGIMPSDRLRISEKLAYALSLGGNPKAAAPLFQRILASYRDNPVDVTKTIEILLQQARQAWLDCKMDNALSLTSRAIWLAEAAGVSHLRKILNIKMATHLFGLHRRDEAKSFLSNAGEISDTDDASTRAAYYKLKCLIAANNGNATDVSTCFEQAVRAAKEDPDIQQVASVWRMYAYAAVMLGDLHVAKARYERALLVARQFHIAWFIPWVCLEYAKVLSWLGKYGAAHDYLLDALSYDAQTATLDGLFSEVGIPLALHMKDEAVLAKCVRPSSIDFAFRSTEPDQIGPISAAFAQWYVSIGREQEAHDLLHRAAGALHDIAQIWDFPIAVARFGVFTDIPKARRLIELRISPAPEVANACLQLFDAFVAQRQGRREMMRYAIEAEKRFTALAWHSNADLARALRSTTTHTPSRSANESRPFADMMPALTLREQQVAELVLKGLSNKGIATELSISINTVESHMASIMNRLGIRSRHQLINVFTEPDM